MSKQKTTIRKVLRYVRPYYAALFVSLFLALLFVAMSLYIPILVGQEIASDRHLRADCSTGTMDHEPDQ